MICTGAEIFGYVTEMMTKPTKRKNESERCTSSFKVSNIPLKDVSYSCDDVFYYILGQFREKVKKTKVDATKDGSSRLPTTVVEEANAVVSTR